MNQLQIFEYKGNKISFEVNGRVLINVTEFAKSFPDKNLTQIIQSNEIQKYIEILSKLQNYSLTDLLRVERGGNNPGTWANSKVALRIAQKLSPEFAVWVDSKIEELLTTGKTQLDNLTHPTRKQLAQWVIELEEAKELADQKIKELSPKAEVYDKISECKNLKTIQQVAKDLGTGEHRLFKWLRENNILMSKNIPYQRFLEQGYFEVRTRPIPNLNENYSQTYVTPKGELWLAKIWSNTHILN